MLAIALHEDTIKNIFKTTQNKNSYHIFDIKSHFLKQKRIINIITELKQIKIYKRKIKENKVNTLVQIITSHKFQLITKLALIYF